MKVDATVDTIPLGNNGITFKLYDQGKHRGDLRVGRATVEWRKTRSHKPAVSISLEKLLELLEGSA